MTHGVFLFTQQNPSFGEAEWFGERVDSRNQ